MKDKRLDYTSRCIKQSYGQRIFVTAVIHTRSSQEVEEATTNKTDLMLALRLKGSEVPLRVTKVTP